MSHHFPFFTISLIVLLFTARSGLSQVENPSKAVDQVFAKWSNTNSPGCAIAVIQDGEIIHQKGYGMADLEHDIPIRPSSVFYIGSVSKQFVAACMLLLDEQGKIKLDEDIRTYIPEFPDYGYKISIRNLIHHTSGIRDNLTLWELIGRSHLEEIPEEEIFELICRQQQLNFEPGTRYMYSNSCYFLMSIIVERVTGQSLREYADEYIFQPLGMKHSIFQDNNRRILKNRAFAYGENPDGSFNNMLMRFDLVGSGGLYSTVEDLYLWDQNFYNNQIGNRGQAFIDDMLTNGRFNDGTSVGYAFALVNGTYKGLSTVSHSGALGGYRAFYIRFPEQKFSVIILGNLESFVPGMLAEKVADIYLKDLLQAQEISSTQQAKPKLPTVSLSRKQLTAMAGYYWNEEEAYSRRIYLSNDTLRYQRAEGNESSLRPIGNRHFIMSDTDEELNVHFQPTASGKLINMILTIGSDTIATSAKYEPYKIKNAGLSKLTGSYYAPELDTHYQIKIDQNQAWLKLKNQPWQVLTPIKGDLLIHPKVGQLYFHLDQTGLASGFYLNSGRVRDIKFQKVKN